MNNINEASLRVYPDQDGGSHVELNMVEGARKITRRFYNAAGERMRFSVINGEIHFESHVAAPSSGLPGFLTAFMGEQGS